MNYADRIKELVSQIKTYGDHVYESESYRMSMISVACDRRIQLWRVPDLIPEEYAEKAKVRKEAMNSGFTAMTIGTLVHQYMEEKLDIISSEEEVRIEGDVPFVGHYDLEISIDGTPVIVDVKTVGKYGDKYLPKQSHQDQLQAYLQAKNVRHGVLLYINRDSGAVHTYEVPKHDGHWVRVLNRFRKIRDAEEQRILLPLVTPNRGGFPCAYCEYESFCDSQRRK